MVEISKWSLSSGHDVVRTYDPETADMKEVNEYVHQLEKETGMKAFDLEKGEVIQEVTKETTDISLTPQSCGG